LAWNVAVESRAGRKRSSWTFTNILLVEPRRKVKLAD
jgi:hypothetical protein